MSEQSAEKAYRSLNYDLAFEAGRQAFAEWEDEGYPNLCPCCGAWQRKDGSPGPVLPNCAYWRGDRSMNPWPHSKSCVRVRDADYGDLCAACAMSTSPGRGARPWLRFDGMTWPDPTDPTGVQWRLRYGPQPPSREDAMVAASFMHAYAHLIDLPRRERDERIRQIREHVNPPGRGDTP